MRNEKVIQFRPEAAVFSFTFAVSRFTTMMLFDDNFNSSHRHNNRTSIIQRMVQIVQ